MTGPGTRSKLGTKLKLEGRSKQRMLCQAARGFSSFEFLDLPLPMGYFFPEAPQALAMLFSPSGQTWALTMRLLLVSPGKWLRGNGRMPFCIRHCPGSFLGGCFSAPGSKSSYLCPHVREICRAYRGNVEKYCGRIRRCSHDQIISTSCF